MKNKSESQEHGKWTSKVAILAIHDVASQELG